MHISASYGVVLLGTGLIFAAQPPAPPPSSEPAASKAATPLLDDSILPQPRSLPRPTPAQPIVEEPAPAPHERLGAPIANLPSGQFREEPAPMPHEQSPMPARFFVPGGPRNAPVPEIESLHREIEKLKMEREALLVEEMDLINAKDLRNSKTADANLRKRLTELLAKAAQQVKKEKETAEAPPPGKTRSPQTPAPSLGQLTQPHSPGMPAVPSASASPSQTKPNRSPGQPPPSTGSPTSSKHSDASAQVVTDVPVDPLGLAQSLFRAGEYTAALNTFRKLDLEQQKPEERIAIQYLMACCLRKLGKLEEASVLYREVANTTGDDFLTEGAQWYLRTLKDRRDLEGQLAELRQRRQAMLPRKP